MRENGLSHRTMSKLFKDQEIIKAEQISQMPREKRYSFILDSLETCEKLIDSTIDTSRKDDFQRSLDELKALLKSQDSSPVPGEKYDPEKKRSLVNRLQQVNIFQGLSNHDLLRLTEQVEEVQLTAGEPFLKQYQELKGVYILQEEAVISVMDGFTPDTRKNGIFGELECLTGETSSLFTITPVANCSALFISRVDLTNFLKSVPNLFAEKLQRSIKILTQELKTAKSEKTNVQEEQRLTKEILENMGVGSFSFNQAGEIGNNYNNLVEDYLGRKNLAGLPFADVALSNDRKALKDYYRALQMLFGGNKFDPEAIISMLPNEANIKNRVFKLRYSFVQDERGNVLSVFVRMEDLTLKRNLEQKEEQEKKVINAMQQNIGGYLLMLEDIEKLLKSMVTFADEFLKAGNKPEKKAIGSLMRSLHGSKGLCGHFELTQLRTVIHNLEDSVRQTGKENSEFDIDSYRSLIKSFKREFKYAVSLKTALGSDITRILQGITFTQTEFNSLLESARKDKFDVVKRLILDKTLTPAENITDNWQQDITRLSAKNGKKIDFQVDVAKNLKVPKSLAHTLNVELGHLYRNCVDHGIEMPAEREKLGKDKEGKINISIQEKNALLSLTIRDDGAGLNLEKIISLAQKKPDLNQEKVKEYISADEVWKILFLPGFSSNTVITETSGRGVGLDAVQTAITELEGTIELCSERNKGCTFIVKLPLERN